jgi:hypothetical protein
MLHFRRRFNSWIIALIDPKPAARSSRIAERKASALPAAACLFACPLLILPPGSHAFALTSVSEPCWRP